MGKIATRHYVSSLAGGSSTGESRCATKNWIAERYPQINVSKVYQQNQLVEESALSVNKTSYSIPFLSNFTDSWGNQPVTVSNVTIENGAARFHSSFTDRTAAYMRYDLGNSFKSCRVSTVELDFNCATRNNCYAHVFNLGTVYADHPNVKAFSIYIDQNSYELGRGQLVLGGIMWKVYPFNEWHRLKVRYDWVNNISQGWVDGVSIGTKGDNVQMARTYTNIQLGYTNHDSLRGWIKNVAINLE